jgi:hypothetical protein
MAPRVPVGIIVLILLFAIGTFLLLWFDWFGLVP